MAFILTSQRVHTPFSLRLSKHMGVCCLVQETRACTNYVSILKEFWCLYLLSERYRIFCGSAGHMYKVRLHTKFEEKCDSHSQDMSEETFMLFRILGKITLTYKHMLQSSWNLLHLWGIQKQLLVPIVVRIRTEMNSSKLHLHSNTTVSLQSFVTMVTTMLN